MTFARPLILTCLLASLLATSHAAPSTSPAELDGRGQRAFQLDVLLKIARPVLQAGAENRLKTAVPTIGTDRDGYRALEALGRTLAGLAPWLELGPNGDAEAEQRAQCIALAVQSIRHAVNPRSTGYLFDRSGGQPLVDTAFFAEALLRAPTQLWGNLDADTRAQVVSALKASRQIKPFRSNWLLFSAMVEAALLEFTGECELGPIDDAVSSHLNWYSGDGTYGDGPRFHWDYYNSFVIQPMLLEVLDVCAAKKLPHAQHRALVRERAVRYAAVQEKMISPEGTYPVIGRSSAYRFGVFHHLSLMALRRDLPEGVSGAAVRSGLTAVIHRMISAPGVFDDQGWLTIGVVGAQPDMGEAYINRGSVYLCTFAFVDLGLPVDDPFWTAPAAAWTQKRIWNGENVARDHAIEN